MRKLHEVAAHETFIASGEYRTYRDGELLPTSEKWTIHELKGGAALWRVDEDGRHMDGLSVLSESLVNPQGVIERFNVRSSQSQNNEFEADYTFHPDYVQIGYKTGMDERAYGEFDLTLDATIYIKQMLYMGLTLPIVIERDGKSHAFSPALFSDEDSQLQKLIVKAADPAVETLSVGRRSIQTRKYQIADDMFYWLDEHNIPIKRTYTHDDAVYSVIVANYAHR